MQVVETPSSMTTADLDAQEKELIQRRDAYVQEANANVASFNGAIMHVQAQRAFLVRRQEEALAAAQADKKGKKPRRSKVAPKETPEATPIGV